MKKNTIFFMLILFLASCNLVEYEPSLKEASINKYNADLMSETASYLTEISSDFDIVNEIYNLIQSDVFTNNSILMESIFSPSDNLPTPKGDTEKFKNHFLSTVSNKASLKSSENSNDAKKMLKEYLKAINDNNVTIYWPYIEGWDGITNPTITFYDGVNKNENIGYKIVDEKIVEVVVNDEYAINNPVWIVNKFEGDPYSEYKKIKEDEKLKLKDYFTKASLKATVDPTKPKISVELIEYYVAQNHQYDGLFDGGSEFKITVLSANKSGDFILKVLDQFNTVSASRWNIFWGVKMTSAFQIKTGWIKSETGISIGCYEWDETEVKKSATFGGHYKIDNDVQMSLDWSLPDSSILKIVGGSIVQNGLYVSYDYSVKFNSDDELLSNVIWDRDWIGTWPDGKKLISFDDLICTFSAVSY